MADNSQEALDELLKIMDINDAKPVADEITRVIARGITEEIETKGKIKELSQRALSSDEAYKVALEMFVASLEPMIMKDYALHEFEEIMGMKSSIKWFHDFVEKSLVIPENYQEVYIPDLGELEKLETDLKAITRLIVEL